MLPITGRRVILSSRRLSVPFRIGPSTLSYTSAAHRPGTRLDSSTRTRSYYARLARIALTGVLSGSVYFYWQKSRPIDADAIDSGYRGDNAQQRRPRTSLGTLLRTYTVYSMCSIPMLVDYSPAILSSLLSVPGVTRIMESFVRVTFFSQFVGGETALETVPVLGKLRAENKGALLAYSVEVDEDEAKGKTKSRGAVLHNEQPIHKHFIDEIIRCIDVAADFEDQLNQERKESTIVTGRRTWVAIKLSALLPDAQSLINFSKHLVDSRPPAARPVCFPGSPRPSDFDVLNVDPTNLPETCPLTKGDIDALTELKNDLFSVCQRAKKRGVKIIIDAEYSWYQPAIDAYQRLLMTEFNRLPPKHQTSILSRATGRTSRSVSTEDKSGEPVVQPLIYGSFQAYLRRTPEHLVQSILDAEAGNYALGVKLVRGAYHPFEVSAHESRRLVNAGDKSTVSASPGIQSPSISKETLSPVWETKEETDATYNACARMLIKQVARELEVVNSAHQAVPAVPRIGILLGTHNWESCDIILETLVNEGLATRIRQDGSEVLYVTDNAAERITMAQLYGTRDRLTDYLVERTRSTDPFVIKYVPYGELSEVMPYLARRAIENKSVLGNGVAQEERREAGSEIRKRLKSLFF